MKSLSIISAGILLTGLILVAFILQTGQRDLTALETIRSLKYPINEQGLTIITEPLAHTDLQLHEPVIGKKLDLTITFIPGNVKTLSVGARQNSFWLSYEPVQFYQAAETNSNPAITTTVSLPLSRALPDTDGSIDLLFFADYPVSESDLALPSTNKTIWYAQDIQAQVGLYWPTWLDWKDFIKSLMKRERVI